MRDAGRAGRRMLLAAAFLFPPCLLAQEEPLGVVVAQAVTAPGRIDARRASRGLGEGGVLDVLAVATFAAVLILSARFFTGAVKPPPPPDRPDARGAPLGRRGRRDAKVFGEKETGGADRLADTPVPEGSKADFAQALIDAGQDRTALRVLTEGRQAGLGKRDYALALRACQRLGEFAAAARIFVDLQDSTALMEAPELYYLYALLCEKAGRLQPAREIYEKLAKRISDYKDVAARLGNLDSVSERDIARLTAALAEPSAAAVPGRPAPLVVAGQFELREPLGVGGMGMVFKGWDRSLSRPVAVKQMRETIARDAGAREQFLKEARLVAALNHPYIVAIHTIATEGADIFLVFEFVDGENLQQIVASRGRIAPRNCVNILHHVCDALAYAHQNGVIHRDLKPANIMHDNKSGHVKVMDFGIAAPAAEGGRPSYCGTPAYMAPEQHAGAACPQSDVFSLGATLYEMLTGELPFKGGRDDLQRRKEAMDYAPPSAAAPGLPEAWDKVVAKCLAPDKRHRFESVKSFMRAAAQVPDRA